MLEIPAGHAVAVVLRAKLAFLSPFPPRGVIKKIKWDVLKQKYGFYVQKNVQISDGVKTHVCVCGGGRNYR